MSDIYEFGTFRYDSELKLLFKDGAVVALVPKAAETLQMLLERRGRVVEKAELMSLIWPDTQVEEIGLARNISILCKAFGDEAESYIETIPKRGYRFAAVPPAAPAPPARKKTARAYLPRRRARLHDRILSKRKAEIGLACR